MNDHAWVWPLISPIFTNRFLDQNIHACEFVIQITIGIVACILIHSGSPKVREEIPSIKVHEITFLAIYSKFAVK